MSTLRYWFVFQCEKDDTKASLINYINTKNDGSGSNKIVAFKYWPGQHPYETSCRHTMLVKFGNHICNKTSGEIFNGRSVIFSFLNANDDKTRTLLMHGKFVITGPYLKVILFRKLKKVVKTGTEELERAGAREIEVTAQLLIEEEKLKVVMKEREDMSAIVTDLQLTASQLQQKINEERKNLEATRRELASLALCTLQQGCAGDRVPIGKRGLDTAAGPSYPVYHKRSKYVHGQLGLFAAKDFCPNEVITRMDNPVPVTRKQERKLSDDLGFRHDAVVSMGSGNNSVWDMDVSAEQPHKRKTKIDIDGKHEEPMWFYMNHRNAKVNVYLHFENINGLRYPVWKAKEAIKIDQELFWSYGIVPNSFKD